MYPESIGQLLEACYSWWRSDYIVVNVCLIDNETVSTRNYVPLMDAQPTGSDTAMQKREGKDELNRIWKQKLVILQRQVNLLQVIPVAQLQHWPCRKWVFPPVNANVEVVILRVP